MRRFVSVIGSMSFLLSVTALATPEPSNLSVARSAISKISIPFVPNMGQWDSRAAFAARTFAGTLFVSTEGKLVYSLAGKPAASDGRPPAPDSLTEIYQRTPERGPGWVLTETLVDARQRPRFVAPVGSRPEAGKVSYAIGRDETRHRDGIGSYERVNLGDVYPGIDVQVRATGSNIEKIFTVAPRSNPRQIRVRLDGAQKLQLGPRGELIAHTGNGPVTYTAPIAYQETASGQRAAVSVRYALDTTAHSYGFRVGTYDAARSLVIDPLLQSTYVGGNGEDNAFALAIHPITGEVYVAGTTSSTDFPKAAGAEQANKSASTDAFIVRLNAALTTRLQSTYLGGNGSDSIAKLAIHPASGEVYAAGSTTSTDFPNVAGAEQSAKGAGSDVFITRLNAALTTRLQSTYLGGDGADIATALAIHPVTGEIYVAGYTQSNDFPKVAGAEQTIRATGGNGFDTFVTRLNAALTTRLQSTYLGGDGADLPSALAIHPASGEVYVAGSTGSSDFPKVAGAEQTTKGASNDAFVTRLNAALTTRLQSTYLGGDGFDGADALAIHPTTGEVYVTGSTQSTDFPKVDGAEQTVKGVGNDAYVTRLNAALTMRLQSTYLGGNGSDLAKALEIHPSTGEVYVAGYTTSSDFPKVAGEQSTFAGGGVFGNDVYVTRLNAALTTRVQSTYLGGNDSEFAFGLAVHPATGEVYVAGYTQSTDFPKVAGAEQTVISTGYDAFVSRMVLGPASTRVTVLEFYNTNLQHYFRTAEIPEANAIDAGAAGPGWQRTGLNFVGTAAGSGSGNDVCRFYNPVANTHFYTADPDECAQVKLPNSGWRYEGLSFRIALPSAGACPQGTIPVYRNYNNRFAFNDSNHRFTTDFGVYNAMIALGWTGEGVVMCATALV